MPDGKDEHDNKEVRRVGEPPKLGGINKPLQHFEIGERLGLMDFETAAKLSGARFVVLKGMLARLERALAAFMLDVHTAPEKDGIGGYAEVVPPYLVRDEVMYGTAQLPKFADDQFLATRTITRQEMMHDALKYATDADQERVPTGQDRSRPTLVDRSFERAPFKEDYWLIPTAEVPLTNLVRDKITDEAELPIRVTAYSPCFRAEAGAAGKDTRGMIRQHQFSKVELVSITTPEQALAEHERMTACAEESLEAAGACLSHHAAVHGRHGLCLAQDLRHRGVAAGPEHLPRDFLVLGVRRLPGAAHECALPTRRAARTPSSCTR